jgi:trehalose-6-phosphatase
VEIRRRSVTKGDAVRAVRDAAPGTRIIAIGDDHTDEDMFARLEPDEAAIVVGKRLRSLHASASLAGPDAVHAFLTWILDMRRGSPRTPPPLGPAPDGRRREARSLGPDRGILAP